MATNTVEHKLNFSKFTPTEQQFLRVAESTILRHLDILLSEVKRKYPLSIDTDFLQSIYVSLVADKVVLLVSRAAVLERFYERQVHMYDFMGECEHHKTVWTDKTYSRVTFVFYNRTARGRMARMVQRIRHTARRGRRLSLGK